MSPLDVLGTAADLATLVMFVLALRDRVRER